jgi:hypothetical protein
MHFSSPSRPPVHLQCDRLVFVHAASDWRKARAILLSKMHIHRVHNGRRTSFSPPRPRLAVTRTNRCPSYSSCLTPVWPYTRRRPRGVSVDASMDRRGRGRDARSGRQAGGTEYRVLSTEYAVPSARFPGIRVGFRPRSAVARHPRDLRATSGRRLSRRPRFPQSLCGNWRPRRLSEGLRDNCPWQNLIHLPDEPAGVLASVKGARLATQPFSPATRGGRGRGLRS